MAEGGDLTSKKDGSDADFKYTCTPCGDDDIREEAVKFCPVCDEYLCTSCTRQHGRRKALRSHTLQDCDASTKGSTVTMVNKCRYHPDRDIEMYCGEHDMVYCTKCIATNHRACSGILNLEDVDITSNQQNDIERLSSDMVNIQKRLEDTERNMQTNNNSIEEQRNDVISQVEAIERDLVQHIQKLKHEALEALETEYTLIKEELATNISQISKVKQEIEKTTSQLQTAHNLNAREQFVQTKLTQQTVNDAMKVFEQSEDKGRVCLRFTENTELKSIIRTSTCLGRVQKVTEKNSLLTSKVYKVSSRKEINVKMTNDSNQCYIIDICQLADGTIILADYYNKRIKRLNVNYNIKDCLDLESSPRGICYTGNFEVAVKLVNRKVWFISVGSSLSKVRDISVTGGDYNGMTYCDGELWVSDVNGVNVYSMTGTLIKTINNGVNGQRIFKSNIQQKVVNGDTVIVTDYSDGAVCLNRDGTVKRELRDKRLAITRGVCVANGGTMFICGGTSHNIMMFDRDGKCLGELVDNQGGLKNPLAMCYDKKKNCVLVASVSSDNLVVLSISH
ncbi:uncharacterized protein LOC132725737 [Ruditapes philippinarum]|uniref:uncharacterized protein LOC132725737 n=1 Tax=Ruditapes philippinarum TaxID=129788 RepID=UPI00295AA35C|nr:uncharacterized protein LOC132725737 [Ruditapes philippinarum]XP_060566909.1 uncharacterized protein LOC132725737 [Ruditapes philippinarum]